MQSQPLTSAFCLPTPTGATGRTAHDTDRFQSLKRMADLTDRRLIYLKGGLFLAGAVLAAASLWLEAPTLRTAVLLGVLIWCSARAYYFAFYVIERYVDPSYRFAGLWDFAKYWFRARK